MESEACVEFGPRLWRSVLVFLASAIGVSDATCSVGCAGTLLPPQGNHSGLSSLTTDAPNVNTARLGNAISRTLAVVIEDEPPLCPVEDVVCPGGDVVWSVVEVVCPVKGLVEVVSEEEFAGDAARSAMWT